MMRSEFQSGGDEVVVDVGVVWRRKWSSVEWRGVHEEELDSERSLTEAKVTRSDAMSGCRFR